VVWREAPLTLEPLDVDDPALCGRGILAQAQAMMAAQETRIDLDHAPLMRLQAAPQTWTSDGPDPAGPCLLLLSVHHII